ncbi:MAG: type IV fimbrial biogenesis protein FimT [Psychromonas sp.]|jgi:type IV fimbrial biogenesis protein FimT|uniref:Tfp pilus assembly protein FimT/FimU n=1 Tax=Psychromonas sp. TaxID=1884585 RepID=UPI0039E3D597
MKHRLPFSKGLTLIELLVAVSVIAILLAIGIPSYKTFFDRDRLEGGATALYFMLNLSKTESIKRNSDIYLKITAGNDWCVGSNEGDAVCDCNSKGSCDAAISHNEYKNLTLLSNYSVPYYDRVRGSFNEPNGLFKLRSESAGEIRLNVNFLGSVRICGVDGVLGLNGC